MLFSGAKKFTESGKSVTIRFNDKKKRYHSVITYVLLKIYSDNKCDVVTKTNHL